MTMPAAQALSLKKSAVFKLVVTITALLSWVIALGAASASTLQNLYGSWHLGRSNALTIYLPPDANPEQVQQLQQSLPTLAGINAATLVPTAQLQTWLKPVIPNPETLPLPTVLEVDLAPSADRPQLISHIRQSFPTAEVDDHQPLLTQVENAVRSLQWGAVALALTMLTLMALLVIFAVRTGLAVQRPVLHLLITLGATDSFLARIVTHQVSVRVLTGSVIGGAAAALTLGLAAFLNTTLAAHVGLNTWAAMGCSILLLPAMAAATAHLTTRQILRHLA